MTNATVTKKQTDALLVKYSLPCGVFQQLVTMRKPHLLQVLEGRARWWPRAKDYRRAMRERKQAGGA